MELARLSVARPGRDAFQATGGFGLAAQPADWSLEPRLRARGAGLRQPSVLLAGCSARSPVWGARLRADGFRSPGAAAGEIGRVLSARRRVAITSYECIAATSRTCAGFREEAELGGAGIVRDFFFFLVRRCLSG